MLHMANLSSFFLVFLLIIYLSQTSDANNHKHNGFSFRMIRRDSLTSPSHQSNISTFEESIDRLFNLSKVRVDSLIDRYNSSHSREIKDQAARPSVRLEFSTGTFLVEVGIGTFPNTPSYLNYFLELDTGGGAIWTQCAGCDPCFHQQGPYFPWSESETYYVPPCDQCPPGEICQQGHCILDVTYGDDTHVTGIKATETFTFQSNSAGVQTFPNLHFGCVLHTENFARGSNEHHIASGLLGLNRDSTSLMGQVGARFRGRFSYCFTHYQGEESTMFLRFGDDIPPLSYRRRQSTPFVPGPRPLYYLDLRAISVGSKRLDNINPSVFKLRRDGSGGCFIDSDIGVSQLVNVAYAEFVREWTRKIEDKNPGLTRVSRGNRLCYQGVKTKFPTMTFHFSKKANLVVQPDEYISTFRSGDTTVYCLTIKQSERDINVIGVYQQVNQRIIYDVRGNELKFEATDCLNNS